jgi:2-oxo-3-hexenedioate decarboxylase
LLNHYDSGLPWTVAPSTAAGFDLSAAYQQALAVRALRLARNEKPRGFKIGFTNRSIWARYQVFAPIWGTVFDSTLHFCEGRATLDLTGTCQPRIEPEVVFGMRSTPPAGATLEALFDAIDWVAPGLGMCNRTCRTGSSRRPTRWPTAACMPACWWDRANPC